VPTDLLGGIAAALGPGPALLVLDNASTSWTAPPTSSTTVSPNDLRSPVALIAGWDGVVVILSPLPLCGPGGHDTSSVPAARFSPVSRWFHTS
jgi:hypothetical protein